MAAAQLENKTALIASGANGAGAASTRLFCQQGASVVFIDRDSAAGLAFE